MPSHYGLLSEPPPAIQRPAVPRPDMMPMMSIAGAFGGPMPAIGGGIFSQVQSLLPKVAAAIGPQMVQHQNSRRDRLRSIMKSQAGVRTHTFTPVSGILGG